MNKERERENISAKFMKKGRFFSEGISIPIPYDNKLFLTMVYKVKR